MLSPTLPETEDPTDQPSVQDALDACGGFAAAIAGLDEVVGTEDWHSILLDDLQHILSIAGIEGIRRYADLCRSMGTEPRKDLTH